MLETLITSKTRVKLLLKFFLNPETRAYLRELATEFGESTNAIRVELNRLTDAKLLEKGSNGRTVMYHANTKHSFFNDIQKVVKKYIGIDTPAEELIAKLGDVQAAYVIGDYAKGKDSGLIDLVLVGDINEINLKEVTAKTEKLISRKIRTVILNQNELKLFSERFDLKNALLIWGKKRI